MKHVVYVFFKKLIAKIGNLLTHTILSQTRKLCFQLSYDLSDFYDDTYLRLTFPPSKETLVP
jgi:hypothetical protein